MNQNINVMKIFDFCKSPVPHGNKLGKETFNELRSHVEKNKHQTFFEISFQVIEFADSSFARESIVLLAQVYRGKKGFILTNLNDEDVIDNIDYAAVAIDQPLALRFENEIRLLGPALTKAELDILLGQQGGKAVITLNSDNQPIKAFASGNFELTKSNLEIYELLKIKKKITTSQLVSLMNLSVQNASSKLKKLVDEGYILRFEETADTGGIEFVYQIIG